MEAPSPRRVLRRKDYAKSRTPRTNGTAPARLNVAPGAASVLRIFRPYSGSPLSPHTLAELAEKLAGLALTSADLEAMGAELAALLDDVHVLDPA